MAPRSPATASAPLKLLSKKRPCPSTAAAALSANAFVGSAGTAGSGENVFIALHSAAVKSASHPCAAVVPPSPPSSVFVLASGVLPVPVSGVVLDVGFTGEPASSEHAVTAA